MSSNIDVSIIAGSKSDKEIVKKVIEPLEDANVSYEVNYISAHRNPEKLRNYIKENDNRIKVYICVAGLSAALPGVVASYTCKPVIGVPVAAKLNGLDALLSIAQMPPGVPVAAVGIDNGKNAALLAIRILSLIKRQ
ncbi:MAG: 5-(carboxyamino)imidazole ribonucleotide mutase [Candidatus Odinarchaeia archaeon]